MSNSKFRSKFIASKKVHAQVRMNNDTFNVNANTTWTEVPMTGLTDKLDQGYVLDGNGVKCLFKQWVKASASLYQGSSTARTNIEIAFAINGTVRPVIGASAYIRNASGHNNSSAHVEDGFEIEENDIITLVSRQEAASGSVTSPVGTSIMQLESEATELIRGPEGTYNESFESDFGNWSNNGSDDFIRLSGPTPSDGTGTVGTTFGSYFVYAECSSGAHAETFIISTSYFRYLRSVSFAYHLQGTDCGALALQYKNKFGSWVTHWSVSGDQGAIWLNANVDFSGLSNVDDIYEIRFLYSGATDWQADCLLDNISVVSV